MHPDPAGAVPVAGGAGMDVRAAARANVVLGLAVAAIALVAATVNPARDFHRDQTTGQYAAPAPAPGAAQGCAATEAEALDLRGAALELVLMGVVQAASAAAGYVAVAGPRRMQELGGLLAAPAYLVAAINAGSLCYVVHGAAVVAVDHCGAGASYLAIGSVLVAASSAVLLGVSLAVTCCH